MKRALIALVAALSAGCASTRDLRRFEFVERHMGCTARVVLYAPSVDVARGAAREAFDAIGAVGALLTDYDEHGLVARLGRGETSASELPDLFLDVMERARRVSELTGGAFDVTVGPLTRLWRDARRRGALPDAHEVEAAREHVGWERVRIDRAHRSLVGWTPGMRLDFGGIGKGFGADRGLARLRELGFDRALVGIEGDLALGAPPPDDPRGGWRIAAGASASDLDETLVLARCGVSTSGDAVQFIEVNGERSAHVLDPRTGVGLAKHVRATVIARDATEADALATAFTVLGPTRAIEIVERAPGVEAHVVELEGATLLDRESAGYRRHVRDARSASAFGSSSTSRSDRVP